MKRKRELGECDQAAPVAPASPDPTELRSRSAAPEGPSASDVRGVRLQVKDESPGYSLVSGEDSVATGYSGGEDDDDGTYLPGVGH